MMMAKVNPDPSVRMSARSIRNWLKYVYRDSKPDTAYVTRKDRESHVRIFAETIHSAGYNPKPENVKQKHVMAAVTSWLGSGISHRTIRNRLATLRWFAAQIGKSNVVYRLNSDYGLQSRSAPDYPDRARRVEAGDLEKVRDPYVRASLVLQREFGLRRKEALMIQPHVADGGDRLVLQSSWTKGGRPREVPITTPSQRRALEEAKALVKISGKSLIPSGKQFSQQRETYRRETGRAGFSALHGLRHAYAQRRYEVLTREYDPVGRGWSCPLEGGPARSDLKGEHARIDVRVRLEISNEMGHGRLNVTYVYLGK